MRVLLYRLYCRVNSHDVRTRANGFCTPLHTIARPGSRLRGPCAAWCSLGGSGSRGGWHSLHRWGERSLTCQRQTEQISLSRPPPPHPRSPSPRKVTSTRQNNNIWWKTSMNLTLLTHFKLWVINFFIQSLNTMKGSSLPFVRKN